MALKTIDIKPSYWNVDTNVTIFKESCNGNLYDNDHSGMLFS